MLFIGVFTSVFFALIALKNCLALDILNVSRSLLLAQSCDYLSLWRKTNDPDIQGFH